jgi:hypothetical protein
VKIPDSVEEDEPNLGKQQKSRFTRFKDKLSVFH